MSFSDADRIHDIERKRLEPPGFDREEHEIYCPCNRWKHPWRLSECACKDSGTMTKEDAEGGYAKGE
jgi:hypothetical protein